MDKAIELATNVLINQDSRGKDSTGVGYINNKGNLVIQKKAVQPKEFVKHVKYVRGIKFLIGHNRNATTNLMEKDKDTEAHPFMSENNEFVLCHNGHITSYDVLKEHLELLGHKFSSGVDSEVLVHFLEELLSRYERVEAMKRFFKVLEGENVLVLFKDKELYGFPGNTAFKVAKIDDGIVIASSYDGLKDILKASTSNVIGLEPLSDNDNQMLILKMKDDHPELTLYGDWDQGYFKYNDFVVNSRIMCDFCKTTTFCEKYKHKDRCLKCHLENREIEEKNKDVENRNIDAVARSYLAPKRTSNLDPKEVYGKCELCNVFFPVEKLGYCHMCGKIMCEECRDSSKHKCNYRHGYYY